MPFVFCIVFHKSPPKMPRKDGTSKTKPITSVRKPGVRSKAPEKIRHIER